MNNILIDTNILIYAIDEDSKYFEKAQQILYASELVFILLQKICPNSCR